MCAKKVNECVLYKIQDGTKLELLILTLTNFCAGRIPSQRSADPEAKDLWKFHPRGLQTIQICRVQTHDAKNMELTLAETPSTRTRCGCRRSSKHLT